ncbi:tetratricopeptide repeat protein [Desulfopila inferna]|uniref:tetratricopeptide repeat protein n=1 Tax=Desulfopila inferna TaxID=468528 RepID=UPI00196416A6|nr:tetratricopeptide repeat protein [Desulfopila inferna]MBM9606486.1 tetratricopeptide repeat protein [Desulfopila inferna]
MDTVTYPTNEVVDFVQEYLIPFRINISTTSMHEKYHTFWTPTTAVLGIKGMEAHGKQEVQRRIGFFEADEFIATLHLGIAKVRINQKEFDTALVHLDRLLKVYPESEVVPEALYFRGVSLYKQNDDPSQLKKAYEHLLSDYPKSPWVKRAHPYRLL